MSVTPLIRRNGSLSSCDPCRRRKLACDHHLPVCGRCLKRGQSAMCHYNAGPVRVARSGPVAQISSNQAPDGVREWQQTRSFVVDVPPHQTTGTHANAEGGVKLASNGLELPPWSAAEQALPSPGSQIGQLGPTSTSVVISEITDSLGIEGFEKSARGVHDTPVAEEEIARGTRVLQYLRGFRSIYSFIERWLSIDDGYLLYRPIYEVWLRGLDDTVNNAKPVQELSRRLWYNTRQPLLCSGNMSVFEWAAQATGAGIRWETLGLIFSMVGLLSGSLSNWDEIFIPNPSQHKADSRNAVLYEMLSITNDCIAFSKECNAINDLVAVLLFESALLTERIHGQASPTAWLRFGETCDIAVLLGLHRPKRPDGDIPFFLCELRTRIFLQIYDRDKFNAVNLGRPPRLSYRHSSLQLPLDLSDDQVCLTEPDLSLMLQQLENGQSSTSQLHRVSWRRIIFPFSIIREKILEIVLGPQPEELDKRVNEIREEISHAYDGLPAFVRGDVGELLDKLSRTSNIGRIPGMETDWRPLDIMMTVIIHAAFHHCEFLLERALLSRSLQYSPNLLTTARNLMTLVLRVFSKTQYLRDFRNDVVSLLAFYAIPSAGVLAVEMIKHFRSGTAHADSLPKSELIQQISVLISALDEVHPGESNHQTCVRGKLALRKVLDELLEPGKGNATSQALDSAAPAAPVPQPQHYDGQAYWSNDVDFMSWLGNTDFNDLDWFPG